MSWVSTQHLLRAVAVVSALAGAVSVSGYTVLRAGHYDLGAHYDPATGWHDYVWDFDARRGMNSQRTVVWVGPEYRREVPGAGFERLADPGSTVWLLPEVMPPEFTPDNFLWLGLGTQQQAPGVFRGGAGSRGEKAMRLVSVEGPGVERGGHFGMWFFELTDRPEWIFTTRDGIGDDDRFEQLRAGFHGHYNTAFTQPGRYEVTVEFYGDLREAHGGGSTAHEVTWTFYVSDGRMDWAEAVEAGDGWYNSPVFGWLYPVNDAWVHSAEHGFWYVRPDGSGGAYVFDPQWDSWVYHSADLYPLAYDAGTGWVAEAGKEGRWQFAVGNGWRFHERP